MNMTEKAKDNRIRNRSIKEYNTVSMNKFAHHYNTNQDKSVPDLK